MRGGRGPVDSSTLSRLVSTPRQLSIPRMVRVEGIALQVSTGHPVAAGYLKLLLAAVVAVLAQALQRTSEQHGISTMRLYVVCHGRRCDLPVPDAEVAQRVLAELFRTALLPVPVVR